MHNRARMVWFSLCHFLFLHWGYQRCYCQNTGSSGQKNHTHSDQLLQSCHRTKSGLYANLQQIIRCVETHLPSILNLATLLLLLHLSLFLTYFSAGSSACFNWVRKRGNFWGWWHSIMTHSFFAGGGVFDIVSGRYLALLVAGVLLHGNLLPLLWADAAHDAVCREVRKEKKPEVRAAWDNHPTQKLTEVSNEPKGVSISSNWTSLTPSQQELIVKNFHKSDIFK